ncbi:hypothetical protein JHK87_004395 [Glycine soja]|nr:hypothetical protein JHK87_004395 [Glycine soja]
MHWVALYNSLNLSLSSKEYTHGVVIRFRSGDLSLMIFKAFEIFINNKEYKNIQVFKEQIEQLKEKEKVLLDENAKLTENGRLSEKVKLLLFGINSVWPIVHLDNILKQIEAVANYQGDSYMGKPVRINCQKAILVMKCSALFSRPLSTSPNQLDGDKITGATNHKSVNLEGSLLVPHLFKDHKRCSYMIANALDKDGKFTTVQVSRKLKQLGLYLPLPKDDKLDVIKGFAPTSGSNSDKDDHNGDQLMEDESQIALRRRKKLVLDGDLERQIKDLHEK